MKISLLTIGFAFVGFLTSFTQAQTIPLTIDSTQSSVNVCLDGDVSSSQLSGSATFNLQSAGPPSGNAQVAGLDLVFDEALDFNLFIVFQDIIGVATVSTSPGEVTLSMESPGAAGAISGNTFAQLGNSLALSGELDIADLSGILGGNQTFDLSGLDFDPADFDAVSVTQVGNVITVSSSVTITEMVDLGVSEVPLEFEVTYVASGVVPDSVLLGDVNLDNSVNFLDIGPFISLLSTGGLQAEADIDLSGQVNFLDIAPFIAILSGQ